MTIFILCDIRRFEPGKLKQFLWIVAGYPASFVKWYCIKLNGCTVFVKQAILDYFKLQLTDTANNFLVAAELAKQLRYAFIGQLQQPFFKLLGLHRIFIDDFFEYLRRKRRNTREIKTFTFRECITDFKIASVKQSHHISGVSF